VEQFDADPQRRCSVSRRASQTSHAGGLEQPQVRPIPAALKWVTDHRAEYWGQWVAVGPDGLVAAAETFDALAAKLPSFDGVLVSYVV
jgi:hypothetical protein